MTLRRMPHIANRITKQEDQRDLLETSSGGSQYYYTAVKNKMNKNEEQIVFTPTASRTISSTSRGRDYSYGPSTISGQWYGMKGTDMNTSNSTIVSPSDYLKSPPPMPPAATAAAGSATSSIILPQQQQQQHETRIIIQQQYQPYQQHHQQQQQQQQLGQYTTVVPTNHDAVCINPVSYCPNAGGYAPTTSTTTPQMAPTLVPHVGPHGGYYGVVHVTSYYTHPVQSTNSPGQQVYTYYTHPPPGAGAGSPPEPQEPAHHANHITYSSAASSPQLANSNSAAVENGSYSVATSSNSNVTAIPENNHEEQFQQEEEEEEQQQQQQQQNPPETYNHQQEEEDDNGLQQDKIHDPEYERNEYQRVHVHVQEERHEHQYERKKYQRVHVQKEELPPAKRQKIESDDGNSSDEEDDDDEELPSYTTTYYSPPPAHSSNSYWLQAQDDSQCASEIEDLPVSANKCIKVSFDKKVISEEIINDLTKDEFRMPEHLDLCNYKNVCILNKADKSSIPCVMCGIMRPHNKKKGSARTCVWIPSQNKGLCTECDVSIWQIQESNGLIRWCKGCKNFRPWKFFGGKFFVTKCVPCREGQKERYKEKRDSGKSASKSMLLPKEDVKESSGNGKGGLLALIAAAATDQIKQE